MVMNKLPTGFLFEMTPLTLSHKIYANSRPSLLTVSFYENAKENK